MDIKSIAALRDMLAEMEADVQLLDLSAAQRDVLYAAHLLSSDTQYITVSALREHRLTHDLTQATFYRAISRLIELGLIERSNVYGGYVVSDEAAMLG